VNGWMSTFDATQKFTLGLSSLKPLVGPVVLKQLGCGFGVTGSLLPGGMLAKLDANSEFSRGGGRGEDSELVGVATSRLKLHVLLHGKFALPRTLVTFHLTAYGYRMFEYLRTLITCAVAGTKLTRPSFFHVQKLNFALSPEASCKVKNSLGYPIRHPSGMYPVMC
jgi:hypothetical protein